MGKEQHLLASLRNSPKTLLSLNDQQLARTRYQLAIAGLEEFKKPVYDSKFTKLKGGMSFVNS
jgi:hypothetical protein